MRRLLRLALAAVPVLGGAAACDGEDPPTLVFAAASLAESFEALAAAFEAAHPGAEVELHFAGTPRLVAQLRAGAPAEVFASADAANLERVVEAGRAAGPPRTFARGSLVLVVAPGNPRGVEGLADWTRADLRVALCGPEVPAGRYARAALGRAGLPARTLSDEPSVRALLSKVELGELDAGIVYATDARAAGGRVEALPVGTAGVAAYPLVVLEGARPAAAAFADFVLSPEGQRILRSFGFEAP